MDPFKQVFIFCPSHLRSWGPVDHRNGPGPNHVSNPNYQTETLLLAFLLMVMIAVGGSDHGIAHNALQSINFLHKKPNQVLNECIDQ